MQQRPLGPSGVPVSELALGGMTFGAESDERESRRMLDRFADAGGTLIDLADVYTAGAAEQITGRWLAGRGGSEGLVIATKARHRMGPGPEDVGLGRAHLRRGVEASLRRLGIEAIDLFQTHAWDPLVPLEETLEALDGLVREGKIRHVGMSNVTGWQLQRAVLLARCNGWAPVVSLQPQWNLLSREVEWELIPLCELEGLAVLPWSPLAGGWLTGKYRRGAEPAGATRLGEDPARGLEAWARRDRERTWAVVEEAAAVARERGVTPAQVAINWLRRRPATTSVILGARTAAQLDENLASLSWELDPAEAARLDRASAPPTPDYPYGFIDELDRARRDEASAGA